MSLTGIMKSYMDQYGYKKEINATHFLRFARDKLEHPDSESESSSDNEYVVPTTVSDVSKARMGTRYYATKKAKYESDSDEVTITGDYDSSDYE